MGIYINKEYFSEGYFGADLFLVGWMFVSVTWLHPWVALPAAYLYLSHSHSPFYFTWTSRKKSSALKDQAPQADLLDQQSRRA